MPLPQQIRVNRAETIVHQAFQSIQGQLLFYQQLRPFSLWDLYYGINPSIAPHWFQLLNYQTILDYDNKASVARKVAEHAIENVFPNSYFSVADALASEPEDDTVWFIKPTYGTAGKGITCLTTTQLAKHHLAKHHFIQQQVTPIDLIDGRKYTARAYVFVHNKRLYLFDDGFVMIHGVPYQAQATDHASQVDHAGYHLADGAVKMTRIAELPEAAQKLAGIRAALQRLQPALENYLDASSMTAFGLLGIDLLFTPDHQARFIEINAKANFSHTEQINQQLNVPFFAAFLSQLYTERPHPRLQQL